MAEPIDPMLAGKLDAYTVPALPADFVEYLVAVALAEPEPTGSELPKLRRIAARRWLHGGVSGLGVIAVGMISISAAAMGYFGEPIRHAVEQAPVVGKVIERVLPKSLHHAKAVAPAKVMRQVAPPVEPPAPAAPVTDEAPTSRLTQVERRQRLRSILADPESRQVWIEAHPRAAQRIARRRAEFQRRRADAGVGPSMGDAFQGPVRPLMRGGGLTPMERRERIEELRERRQLMRERRGMLRDDRAFRQPFRGDLQP